MKCTYYFVFNSPRKNQMFMRKLFILLSVIIISISSSGQAVIGKMYIVVPDFVTVYAVGPDNKPIMTKQYRASHNVKFTVTGFTADNFIKVTFWRFTYPGGSAGWNKARSRATVYDFPDSSIYVGSWSNYKEFAIKPDDLNSYCVSYFGSKNEFTWGFMTLPIKLRSSNDQGGVFNYEEKLNLGFVAGWRWQLQGKVQRSINAVLGFGVTNVRTDSISLKSGINPYNTSSGAFSANIGLLYSHQNFQIGLFLGKDYIPGLLGKDWRFQGRTWLGLALGISLFSNENPQGGEGKNTEDK